MPILRAGTSNKSAKRRGFTLLELLVVLVIMLIMSTAVVVSMVPALEQSHLRAGSRIIVAALTYARSYAVTHNTRTRVVFDTINNGVLVEAEMTDQDGNMQMTPLTTTVGRYHRLPEGVAISVVQFPGVEDITEGESQDTAISFSPLGQAENASITVKGARNSRQVIALDAVTGRCTMTDGSDE